MVRREWGFTLRLSTLGGRTGCRIIAWPIYSVTLYHKYLSVYHVVEPDSATKIPEQVPELGIASIHPIHRVH